MIPHLNLSFRLLRAAKPVLFPQQILVVMLSMQLAVLLSFLEQTIVSCVLPVPLLRFAMRLLVRLRFRISR